MDKETFDAVFSTTLLNVNTDFNSPQAMVARKYDFEKYQAAGTNKDDFNRLLDEQRLYTEKLLYELLSNLLLDT